LRDLQRASGCHQTPNRLRGHLPSRPSASGVIPRSGAYPEFTESFAGWGTAGFAARAPAFRLVKWQGDSEHARLSEQYVYVNSEQCWQFFYKRGTIRLGSRCNA
jgi:hypothetical protein